MNRLRPRQRPEDGVAHILAALVVIVVVTVAALVVVSTLHHSAALDADAVTRRAANAVASVTTTGSDGRSHAASGIVVRDDGTVVTTNDVIAGAQHIAVRVGGRAPTRTATVVGYDRGRDIAVLHLDGATDAVPPTFASTPPERGMQVAVVGDALGLGGAPTGVAGKVTRTTPSLSINVPTAGGVAGGPVLDRDATVVAMVVTSPTKTRETLALPIATVASVVAEIAGGNGGPGVHLGPSATIAGVLTAPTGGHGANVTRVAGASSPATLHVGDTIVSVDDATIGGPDDLDTALESHKVGDTVTLAWLDHANALRSAPVVLVAGPPR